MKSGQQQQQQKNAMLTKTQNLFTSKTQNIDENNNNGTSTSNGNEQPHLFIRKNKIENLPVQKLYYVDCRYTIEWQKTVQMVVHIKRIPCRISRLAEILLNT